MNNITRTYNLTQTNQLFDLNGESTNFDIYYKIQTENNTPFHLAVVNQTILDSNIDYKFTRVDNGEFTGRKRVEDNEFQNYYLVLRADNECSCSVDIIKTALPSTIKEKLTPVVSNKQPTSNRKNYYFYMLIGLILLGGGYAFYTNYTNYTNKTNNTNNTNNTNYARKQPTLEGLAKGGDTALVGQAPVTAPRVLATPIKPPSIPMSNLAQTLKKLDI